MTAEEAKSKVVEIATCLGEGLAYDEDDFPDDWDDLAREFGEMARHCMLNGCRIASYAGIAAKKARGGG